jgi:hypothetical protein
MNVRSKRPIRRWPRGMPKHKQTEYLSAELGAY